MYTVCIDLKSDYPVKGGTLKGLIMDNPWDDCYEERLNWKRPALIVVPGGTYYNVSKREGETVVSKFFAKGFQVFLLEYLCRPQGVSYPEQLFELSCAIDYVKNNAKKYNINKDEIFTVGFSAGGHLVCDQSNEYPTVSERLGRDIDCRPTAVALGYPVINDHNDSFDFLLFGYNDENKKRLKEYLKLDRLVTENTPPTFVWTTAEDSVVSPINSLEYCMALTKKHIPYELHIYPKGEHGKSTGSLEENDEKDWRSDYSEWKFLKNWLEEAIRFFRSFIKEKF